MSNTPSATAPGSPAEPSKPASQRQAALDYHQFPTPGKIAIAAAKEFGAKAVGIEYNKDLAALANRNAQRAGIADKVRIVTLSAPYVHVSSSQ